MGAQDCFHAIRLWAMAELIASRDGEAQVSTKRAGSRLVLLTAPEAEVLLAKSTCGVGTANASMEVDVAFEAVNNEAWEVFYDTVDYKLTMRGWWLCENASSWSLRLPAFEVGKASPGYAE